MGVVVFWYRIAWRGGSRACVCLGTCTCVCACVRGHQDSGQGVICKCMVDRTGKLGQNPVISGILGQVYGETGWLWTFQRR